MTHIKGMTVVLIDLREIGVDPFGAPIYEEREIEIENVLIQPNSAEDMVNQQNLTGEEALYTLAIPKGDKNTWENRKVKFFGETWRTVGVPLEGIEDMIPLDWNKKVVVERYE